MKSEPLKGQAVTRPRLSLPSPETLRWLLITPRAPGSQAALAGPPPHQAPDPESSPPAQSPSPGFTLHHEDVCEHLSRGCQGGAGSPPGMKPGDRPAGTFRD